MISGDDDVLKLEVLHPDVEEGEVGSARRVTYVSQAILRQFEDRNPTLTPGRDASKSSTR